MGRVGTATWVILVSALGVALAAQAVRHAQLRGEFEDLRSRLEKLERRPKDSLPASHAEGRREPLGSPNSTGSGEPSDPGTPALAARQPALLTPEEIQKIVDQKLEERLEEKLQAKLPQKSDPPPAPAGDRKMPLHDMAKELALDPESQAKVSDIANTAKREIFDIVRTPRPDGTNFADELLDVMLKGDQAGAQKIFQRLFTEKIPGTDTSYIMAVSSVQEKANVELQSAMGAGVYQRYLNMNVHPENIETGFDPWGAYLKTRAGK